MATEEELRQRKIEELQQTYQQQREAEQRQLEAEIQAQALLKKYLDEKALERLNNVKLVNRELYAKAFQAVMAMVQRGYVTEKINEGQIKQILFKLKPEKEFTIRRK